MLQLQDHTLAVLKKYKSAIINDFDAIRLCAQDRFGYSADGIEKTLEELHAHASGICLDSQRFGHFRHDLAVFAHIYILKHYPGDSHSQLYVAQMSSNF